MKSNHVFIIAEAGSNWRVGSPGRDMKQAKQLIDAAAEAGADAVKFQTYRAETVYVPNAGMSDYLTKNGIRKSIIEIFRDLEMPYEMVPPLAAYCKKKGIEFMSSVFAEQDFNAVDPYVKRHKIASYEISHARLIERCARSKKPLILSTGAATLEDIDWAVRHFKKSGGRDLSANAKNGRASAESIVPSDLRFNSPFPRIQRTHAENGGTLHRFDLPEGYGGKFLMAVQPERSARLCPHHGFGQRPRSFIETQLKSVL